MDFPALLDRFAAAVRAHDSAGFAALFTADGRYDDYFFGAHVGRDAIAAMLDRFYVGGEDFVWQFVDPVEADGLGYASYCFSYRSREPESAGRIVGFEGISRFRLRDGLIARYDEVFDRGAAFAVLGYAPERVAKLAARYGSLFVQGERMKAHLAYRAACVGAHAGR